MPAGDVRREQKLLVCQPVSAARVLRHVEALYALMRVGDDRVDVTYEGFDSPLAAIEDWERTYWQAFETGHSDHPVMRAYLHSASACGIPAEVMTPYFRAMKEDLTVTRYPTFADLLHYMEGSALPVGRAMTYILGVRPPYTVEDTLPHADSLSIAMQLSNFWRDIGPDWRIGRVYLPGEDLARFRVTEADLAAGRITPDFIALLEFEIERTEAYYRNARIAVRRLATGRVGVMAGWKSTGRSCPLFAATATTSSPVAPAPPSGRSSGWRCAHRWRFTGPKTVFSRSPVCLLTSKHLGAGSGIPAQIDGCL